MPSHRRTRRAARPGQRFSQVKATRPKSKSKGSHRPRLVRRLLRKLDTTKMNSKPIDLHFPGQAFKNTPLRISAVRVPHNDVAASRTTTSFYGVAAEITAIPNPVQQTSVNATNTVGAGYPLFGAISSDSLTTGPLAPTTVMATRPIKGSPSRATFSALPPLMSASASSTVTTTEYTRATFPSETLQLNPSMSSPPGNLKSHQITVVVIVLLSVGSGLLLLGVCVIVKICTRPRRQPRPTPSLPVMKDIEADEDYFESKESPIFGGEARMSSTTGNNGPTWNWIQYPHVTTVQPPTAHSSQDTNPCSGDSHYATQYPVQNAPSVSSENTGINLAQPSQGVSDVAVTSNKRFSISSNTFCKALTDPMPESNDERQEMAFTADGHDVMKRSKLKANNRRSRQPEGKKYRESTSSFVGLAYDSADMASPAPVDYVQMQETPVAENFEGRAKVRSGYFAAGTYPRISTLPSATYSIATATRINIAQRNSFSKDKLLLQRSNSKRMRDTQALTYALGLASPKTDSGYGVASPQPTLYPDDSMSVLEARRPKKGNIVSEKRAFETVPDVPVIIPTQMAGSKSNGSLMTMNFGVSHMSLTGPALEQGADQHEPSRKTDKPPRVPSPPPLPSLTQMALAHSNLEAYANYRSPTYSFINLKPKDNDRDTDLELAMPNNAPSQTLPSLWGIPLKYLSLVALAVQNSALTIIMHYSRVSTPPSRTYSAATAVLMNEILKGTISLLIAFSRIEPSPSAYEVGQAPYASQRPFARRLLVRLRELSREIFSQDCWKLSIPAILYVIQNNLQYVAASNLEAATFQVTYQMKILTTAAFSVLLLRKKLSTTQWLSLLFLAVGVGIVQIQSGVDKSASMAASATAGVHSMNPMKGFLAVFAACFTSGLAGVYFEMVLKNSQADLWVRNVQLSLFSLLPAFAPIIFDQHTTGAQIGKGLTSTLFENFGAWAWATVWVQVLGGLVTAMVIKYSDNILKGFATSLSIVISFLASVALFDFQMTITFVLGSVIVLIATWLYNQHPARINLAINKESWMWLKNEKKDGGSPLPTQPQYVSLAAISSTSSLSSLSSSLVATPNLSDSEARSFIIR
ncbi:hypothetical protein CVT25_015254 [Psilocybe cyanescens]|uniref:UDP-galactose transporter n=1 Tax=Psilocybe cyanescens TaxID=93625 RepID=A0A409XRD4_PSICY|nr:hypothetical protein CVT25_015254 [Psilocybe cyanescens]